jgi:tRNA pseudouridine32 synthase/23S rRNA pseudouridine746 synthase
MRSASPRPNTYRAAQTAPAELAREAWPLLSVVHLAPNFVVVDKPAGLHSVPGRTEGKQDSIETRAREVFHEARGALMAHRLDMETSGLMVLGLTRGAHRSLQRQFMSRKVGKEYVALLDGEPPGDEGKVELPLTVDWENRPRQKVDFEEGRAAKTLWRVVEKTQTERGVVTRVSFRPETGRTHQLRVHAATPVAQGGLGCPILGDTLYGDAGSAPRLMLHAAALAFWAPVTGRWVRFEMPAPFPG